MSVNREEKCSCAEMSCPKDCAKNHTHKGFSCEKCHNPIPMKCVAAPLILTSNPPQYQCENCRKTWFTHEEVPNCPIPMTEEKKCCDKCEGFDSKGEEAWTYCQVNHEGCCHQPTTEEVPFVLPNDVEGLRRVAENIRKHIPEGSKPTFLVATTEEDSWEKKVRAEWRAEVKRWPEMDALGSADWWIQKLTTAKEEAKREGKNEADRCLLASLAMMWNQYCGKRGHLYMSAGEYASEMLMRHGLLSDEYSEVEWDRIDDLTLRTPNES